MKNKHLLFILILFICCFNFVKVSGKSYLKGKIIYLDPGHGGIDPGTTYKDIKESDINLSICLLLKDELEQLGAKVYLTREGDYDLSNINTRNHKRSDLNARIKAINDSNADMFISIHLNSTTSSRWSGAQVFYDDVNQNNEKIADIMTEAIKTKRKKQKINNRYLYHHLRIPGVLIEVGFLSNYQDRSKLVTVDYQNIIVKQIVNGILNYYD